MSASKLPLGPSTLGVVLLELHRRVRMRGRWWVCKPAPCWSWCRGAARCTAQPGQAATIVWCDRIAKLRQMQSQRQN